MVGFRSEHLCFLSQPGKVCLGAIVAKWCCAASKQQLCEDDNKVAARILAREASGITIQQCNMKKVDENFSIHAN